VCFLTACSAIAPSSQAEAVTSGDGPGGAHVIYLNFDGVTVQPATDDDATQNQSAIAFSTRIMPAFDAGPYAPATLDQVKNAILLRVTQLFAPYNVLVTADRPQSGRYTMAVIGGTPSALGLSQPGASGVAALDCANQNESNVVFVFSAQFNPAIVGTQAPEMVAIMTAKELGRSYGLADTQNNLDVMNTELGLDSSGNPTATGFASGLHNAVLACAGATQQDSAGLLGASIGFATADGGLGPVSDASQVGLDQSVVDASMPIDASVGLDAGAKDLAVPTGPGTPPVGDPGCSMGGGGAGLPFACLLLLTLIRRRRAARS
jgi:hypothetical protein